VSVVDATAVLVTFNSGVSPDAVSGANSLSFYTSADKRELLKRFSGDTGRLSAFVVPGNSIHYVADVRGSCGPVAFTVVPLRGYWTQVRVCCGHDSRLVGCIRCAVVVVIATAVCVCHHAILVFCCLCVLSCWVVRCCGSYCCCRASLQERSLAREPSLPWALWVLSFLLSMEQVLFPLSSLLVRPLLAAASLCVDVANAVCVCVSLGIGVTPLMLGVAERHRTADAGADEQRAAAAVPPLPHCEGTQQGPHCVADAAAALSPGPFRRAACVSA
jgi:hypothetical protein